VTGVFVNGTSGESVSLNVEEREKVLECWMKVPQVKSGRMHLIAHIGCNNFPDTKRLALHAEKVGALAMGFMAPSYFKPTTEEELADILCKVAEVAPHFPLYYYHIPILNDINLDVEKTFDIAHARCPNVLGVKYTCGDIEKYSDNFFKKYNVLNGFDPMIYRGLKRGC